MQKTVGFLLAGLALVIAKGELWGHHLPQRGFVHEVERREIQRPIRNFSLIDQRGNKFESRSLRGKVVLVGFIYTSCPDLCPLITVSMNRVRNHLTSAEQKSLFLLSVTTDPEVDSPEVLNAYARRYGLDLSNWALLTGKVERLKPVWKNFGVSVERKARGLVSHTLLTGLLDRKGTMKVGYTGGSPPYKEVLKDIRTLLR